jgi:hypothetical protein
MRYTSFRISRTTHDVHISDSAVEASALTAGVPRVHSGLCHGRASIIGFAVAVT